MTRVLAVTTLVTGIAIVSAQNLTPACTSALGTVATNSDASACLAPAALVGIAASNSSTSLVDPINNWLSSLCAASICSNSTLDFIVNTVTDGCAQELSLLGYNSNQKTEVASAVKQYYPTVRRLVCLKDGNDICITKELQGIQNVVGPLSIDNVVKIAMGGLNSTSSIPKDVTCSNCSKAQYNLINTEIPGLLDDSSKSEFQNQCGASFVDGNTPGGISQTASNGVFVAETQKNGALRLLYPASAGVMLSVLFSAFMA
ncbi:hypothetical protein L218DRAFT_973110 [Marasmius fiardii PR-910]|nr:hypothetical protein L218DRAFT_973110 [Marasmius fiardii PR-910]